MARVFLLLRSLQASSNYLADLLTWIVSLICGMTIVWGVLIDQKTWLVGMAIMLWLLVLAAWVFLPGERFQIKNGGK